SSSSSSTARRRASSTRTAPPARRPARGPAFRASAAGKAPASPTRAASAPTTCRSSCGSRAVQSSASNGAAPPEHVSSEAEGAVMRIPRRLVAEFFGEDAQVRELVAPEGFNGALFVIDAEWGGELVRFLASVSDDSRQELTQQSAMSLARPSRLVFHYERLMSLAFAFAGKPRSALLLGLGGGSMARYVREAWPECELAIVERSEEVIDLARRWFGVAEEIIAED